MFSPDGPNDIAPPGFNALEPAPEVDQAVGKWWLVAKDVFRILTKDEPQRCKALDGIAQAKIGAYERLHGKGAKGAQRYRGAGIVSEVQKAFKAIYRPYGEKSGESLRPDREDSKSEFNSQARRLKS